MSTEQTLPALTDQQDLFCHEYVIDFNGSKAAIRAGYSENSSRSIASELLTKPNIQAKVQELKDDIFTAVGITQARTYREIARVAYSDIAEAYGENGALLPVKDIPKETRAAIVGIDVDEIYEGYGETRTKVGETVKVKFADKLNALAQIVKIGGWASADKMELTGKDGSPLQQIIFQPAPGCKPIEPDEPAIERPRTSDAP